MPQINTIFKNLDTWRHLPTYQLERRLDAFLSFYLPGFIQSRNFYKSGEVPKIIPEFPIKTSSHDLGAFGRGDYAIFHSAGPVYFLELKTDNRSVEQDPQIEYLRAADGELFAHYFDAVFHYYSQLPDAPDSWKQYQNLFDLMVRYSIAARGNNLALRSPRFNYNLAPAYKRKECKVIYLVPNKKEIKEKKGFNPIKLEFADVCKYLSGKQFENDSLAKILCHYLECWASMPANFPLPLQ